MYYVKGVMLRITKWQGQTVLDAVVFHPGDSASGRGIHPILPVKGDTFPSLGLALGLKESPHPDSPHPVIGHGRATLSSTPPSAPSQSLSTSEEGAKGTRVTKVSHYCPYWGSDQAQGQGSSGSSKATLKVRVEWRSHRGSAARSTGSQPTAPCSFFKCLFN